MANFSPTLNSTAELLARAQAIERDRQVTRDQRMKQYDETVYRPALEALRVDCAAAGHAPDGKVAKSVKGNGHQHCRICGLPLWPEA